LLCQTIVGSSVNAIQATQTHTCKFKQTNNNDIYNYNNDSNTIHMKARYNMKQRALQAA